MQGEGIDSGRYMTGTGAVRCGKEVEEVKEAEEGKKGN